MGMVRQKMGPGNATPPLIPHKSPETCHSREIIMNLSSEQIQQLAELERRMDVGEQPFVRWLGHRLSVFPNVMTEFGLQSGQTVSDFIAGKIMEAHLASIQAKIALRKITTKD
jgi:hypothetical protein